MQVRTKLALCVGSLAGVVVLCAILLLISTYSSSYNRDRLDLAYRELGGYLQLSAEISGTFNLVRRDLMDEDRALTFDLAKAERSIFEAVRAIEIDALEEAEIGLRPRETESDVSRVEALRSLLSEAIADVRKAEQMIDKGDVVAGRALLLVSLGVFVEGRIDDLMKIAIEDEREEVAVAIQETERIERLELRFATAAAIAGLLLTALILYILASRVDVGLRNLETGASIFAAGRLDHRIPVSGRDEFAVLSARFNTMAGQLLEQRDALEDARNELEQRVAERTDALRAVNGELNIRHKMRTQFLADIGHELRTPITAMRGEAEVALRSRKQQREAYRSALERIVGITDQLTRFVNDIFLIARQQAGVIDMRRGGIDLSQAISSAVDHLQTVAVGKGAVLSLALPIEKAKIEGDEQRIRQLVQVLVTNAILHSGEGVKIDISLQHRKDGWRLTVSDNGPGIPNDQLPHVFERYYRGGKLASKELQGTGLGLPIAKSIVEAHGGRIWIDQNQPSGTAVHVHFSSVDDDVTPDREATNDRVLT